MCEVCDPNPVMVWSDILNRMISIRDLCLEINYEGVMEEFHQKGTGTYGNTTMYNFHKDRRLALQSEINKARLA